MGFAPGSLGALRGSNRVRVIESVQRRGGASRVELVRATGLSRSTVSSVVAELLAERVLVEQRARCADDVAGGAGRPAIRLTLNPDIGVLAGVHLRHDGVRIAIADLAGTVRAESLAELDVDHHPRQAIDHMLERIPALLVEAEMDAERLLAAGVAVSAPMAPRTPTLGLWPRWRDVDVRSELRSALGAPVYIGNDANLGCIAERTSGAAKGVDDLVYVMMADGVGAGLVMGGSLYSGAHGAAGELGHVVVHPDGPVCWCGSRGCLETVSGTAALTASLRHSHGPDLTLSTVLQLVRDGDLGAQRAVADAGRAVGRALAGICVMLDPRLVVVGGRLAAAGAPLLDGIRHELVRWLPPSLGAEMAVVAGRLGARAEVLGAIAMAGQQQPALPLMDVFPAPGGTAQD